MKKLFLLTCALVAMAASSMAYDYDWASANGAGAIYYKLNSPKAGEATVVAGEWQYRDNVDIPDVITISSGPKAGTYKVTTIGKEAFNYCYDVISVKLGKNVTTIKSGAFTRSSGPTRKILNDKGEFVEISGIMINIDSEFLTTIESAAFSVTTLAPNRGADTLAIGKNVAGLSSTSTFFSWVTYSNVKTFYVDPTSETLCIDEKGVLYSFDKKKLYCFPPKSTETTYAIPSKTETLAAHAFMKAANLTTVTGGEGLKTLGSDVLSTTILKFPVGPNVSSMPTTAFMYCSTDFLPEVDDANPIFKLRDSVLYKFTASDTILCQYFKCRENPTFIVPSMVTQITTMAFYGASSYLKVIDYANCTKEKLTFISGEAFLSTSNDLKFLNEQNVFDTDAYGVIYTDGFKGIRLYASDVSTKKYLMPEATTEVPRNVIKSNGFVEDFYINKNCTTINTEHLDLMLNLQHYEVHDDNPNYSSDADGVLYNKGKTKLLAYPRGNDRIFYKVAPGTKTIGVKAFYNNANLVGLDLGDALESAYEGNAQNLSTMNSLQYMRVGTANPPIVNSNTFSESMYKRKTILYVPEEHFDIYVNASVWNRFAVVKDTSYFNGDLTNTKISYYACHYKENLAGDGWESPERVTWDGYILRTTTAEPRNYQGFDFDHCEQAPLERKNQEIPFYYRRKEYNLAWKNGNETVDGGRFKYDTPLVPPDVDLTAPEGKHFVGWHYNANSQIALTFDSYSTLRCDTVFYAIFVQNGSQQYTVEHRQQDLKSDGTGVANTYTVVDTDMGFGPEGSTTSATAKEYYGFSAPQTITQKNINADGSTVVTIDYARKKFTVAWKKNGAVHSSTTYNNSFYYGTKLKVPGKPSVDAGYTFLGWNTDPDATTALDLTNATVDGDVTYHAIIKQNSSKTYAVRHYLQNIDDDNYPLLPYETDIKTGIIGTKSQAEAKNYEGFNIPTVSQVTLAANTNPIDIKYTRKKFVVTWKKDESTTLWTGELKYGAPLNPPANPVHDDPGKHFIGWNTDKNATEGMNVIATVTGEVTYYAIFADNNQGVYTINHYLQNIDNDNYPATPSQSTSGADLIGRTAVASALNITGFTATENELSETIAAATGTELNFYYTRNKYQVTWKNGDATISSASGKFKYESPLQAPNENLVTAPAGKHLLGWNTSASATDAIDLTNKTVDADESKNVYYAIFTDNENRDYIVKHFLQNTDGSTYADPITETLSAPFGSMTNATAKTYDGFTAPNSITQLVIAEDVQNPTVVEIRYTRNKYPVVWMNGESEYERNNNCLFGSQVQAPQQNPAAVAGQHFVGWNTNKDAKTAMNLDGQTVPLNGVTYYAIFATNDEKTYTINHYKENVDGTWPADNQPSATTSGSGIYGLNTQAIPNTYEGFTHDPNFEQPIIKEDGSTVVKIKYNRNVRTLTWDANEGTLSGTYTNGTVKFGATITEPKHSRTGYDFVGWGLSADATSYENIPATMPDANLTYYAIWEIQELPVRWNFNNGSNQFSTSYVKYGDSIKVAASIPAKENYHFLGWSEQKNGTPITNGDYGIRGAEELKQFYAQWEINSYTLTWDANGGEIVSAPSSGSIQFGAPITPATARRTGYALKGWAATADATSQTNLPSTMPGHDTTFFAVWQIRQYSIAWNANGGELATEGTNGTFDFGTPITPATTKDREGYNFIGWSTEVNGSPVDVAETIPDNDLTYYAVWQKHVHQLTWDANGGYFVNGNTSGEYEFDSEIIVPQVNRDGWKCAGWGLTPDATPNEVVTPLATMPDRDLSYYTIWITRDDNIVSWKRNYSPDDDFNYTATNVTTNEVITAPTGGPTREHYQFIGWSATRDGEVINDFGIMTESKKDFYAQWALNTHKLAWDANGGEIVTAGTTGDNVAYGSPIKEATAARTGFSFVGWGTSADATENDIIRITAMPDEDVTYYAIWATNTYDITWMFNNGTGESFAVTHVPFEGKILAPNSNPARDHYDFAGWAATPEGDAIDDFGTLTTPGAIYYAQWQAQKFTLGWDANGGQLSGNYTQPGEIAYGTPITVPTVTLANFIHAGWGTSVKPDSLVNITTMPDSSVTFVAMWISEQYAVEWRMNDGTDNNYTATHVDSGADIIAPEVNPERTNYQFLGWSNSTEGDIITEFGTMNSNHKIFYAQWLVNSHTLAWNANGGELSGNYSEGNVAVGTEIVKPTATRIGYTYNGWNTYAEAVDSIKITTMPDNDIEYFAIWKVNSYDITWKMNNGTDSIFAKTSLNFGDTIKALTTMPERDEYVFVGWSDEANGSAIDSLGLMPATNVTYYAVWRMAQKNIDWMFSADSIYMSTMVNVGEAITAPAENPVRRNYTFAGWAADINATSAIDDFGVMPETDTAFYAVWEAVLFDALWAVNDGTQALFATTQASVSTTLVAPDSIPSRTNYTFKGWSETADGEPMSSMVQMPEGGITLYAVWTPNEFTAIWKMNDDTDNNFETMKIEMGQPINAPTKNPTRQYYEFVGWSKTADGTVTTNFGTMTAAGAEFFAIWDAIVEFTAPESFVTCEREQKIELSKLSNSEIKFSWSVNGKVDATQTGTTFDIPDDAAYSGTITVTGSFGGKDVSKTITYQRKKMMTRTLWDDVITVVNPDTAFASYRWYHNGELVDTTEYYNEVGGLTGKYYLIATTESGTEICSCESDFGAAPEATMTVYPNPTVDNITVAGSLIETGATISVIDGNGKEWLRKTVETDGSETVRVSQMPQGMYIVKVGDKVVSFIKL